MGQCELSLSVGARVSGTMVYRFVLCMVTRSEADCITNKENRQIKGSAAENEEKQGECSVGVLSSALCSTYCVTKQKSDHNQ